MLAVKVGESQSGFEGWCRLPIPACLINSSRDEVFVGVTSSMLKQIGYAVLHTGSCLSQGAHFGDHHINTHNWTLDKVAGHHLITIQHFQAAQMYKTQAQHYICQHQQGGWKHAASRDHGSWSRLLYRVVTPCPSALRIESVPESASRRQRSIEYDTARTHLCILPLRIFLAVCATGLNGLPKQAVEAGRDRRHDQGRNKQFF